MTMPEYEKAMSWLDWAYPKVDVPDFTPEQIEAASEKYRASLDPQDMSDFPCGLGFVMKTYHPIYWLSFFGIEIERGPRPEEAA